MEEIKIEGLNIGDGIFRFHDGTKQRGIDGFKLGIKLQSLAMSLVGDLDSADPQSTFDKIQSVRQLLKIDDYEESDGVSKGLTDVQVLKVLYSLLNFINDIKKDEPQIQTSQESTAVTS